MGWLRLAVFEAKDVLEDVGVWALGRNDIEVSMNTLKSENLGCNSYRILKVYY